MRDQTKSYVGSERRWGDEDEDGGVVSRVGVVMGDRWWDWVVGRSENPTSWDHHRLHDLGGEVSKRKVEWVTGKGKKNTNLLRAVVPGRWNSIRDPLANQRRLLLYRDHSR